MPYLGFSGSRKKRQVHEEGVAINDDDLEFILGFILDGVPDYRDLEVGVCIQFHLIPDTFVRSTTYKLISFILVQSTSVITSRCLMAISVHDMVYINAL